MTIRFATVFSATLAGLALSAVRADAVAEATSAACTYVFDSAESPRTLKTQEEIGALDKAVFHEGEVLTTTAPDGTVTVSAPRVADGMESLSFNAGGLWTFANSRQGTATFTVRHSIYGTLGKGTADSPAKIVDEEELVDYGAGNGYVFTPCGGDLLLGALKAPSGLGLSSLGDGNWLLVPFSEGCEAMGSRLYQIDTRQNGPDRRAALQITIPIAYTGDNWGRGATAPSTLTFISPSSETTTMNLTGTAAVPYVFRKSGEWTLRLAHGSSTMEAVVSILGGMTIIMR